MPSSITDPSGTAGKTAYRYYDPVPNATSKSWGGQQGRAAGMIGGLNSKNVGADLLAPLGSTLYSPVGGEVIEVFNSKYDGTEPRPIRDIAVNENGGWGTSIVIKGDDGYYHRLSHLVPNSPTVQKGQRIDAGYRVGQVGQSGNTVGSGKSGGAPHLDWEKFQVGPSGSIRGNDRVFADPINDRLVFTKSGYTDTPLKSTRAGSDYPTPDTPAGRAVAAIRQAGRELGADEDLINLGIAIASKETGGTFNNKAAGDKSPKDGRMRSIGIFQLNDEGLGAGMSVEQRQDNLTNARVGMKSLVQYAAKDPNWRQHPGQLAAASQRPADAAGYAKDVTGRYQQVGSGSMPGVPPPGAQGTQRTVRSQQAVAEEESGLRDLIAGYDKDVERLERDLNGYTDEAGNAVEGYKQQAQSARARRAANDAVVTKIGAIAENKRTPQQKLDYDQALLNQMNKVYDAEIEAADRYVQNTQNQITSARNGQRAAQAQLEGKALTPEQKNQLERSAMLDKARADEINRTLNAMADPNSPEANKLRIELEAIQQGINQKNRQLDIDQQRANIEQGRLGVEQGRLGLESERNPSVIAQNEAQAGLYRAQAGAIPAQIARDFAAAGLDDANASRIWATIQPDIEKIKADTKLAGNQAAYQQALADAVNKKIGPEIAQLVAQGKLQQAQADEIVGLMPAKLAQGEAGVRLTEAQTGAQEAQAQATLATALSTIWDNQMKVYYAKAQENLRKVQANPNATQQDIEAAVMSGAKDATEFANLFQQFVNQKTQEEVGRHNRVTEQTTQFQAEETARNNRWNNIANLQNARANSQQAANAAVDDMLGNVRSMNAAAALGATMGVKGVEQVGREHMIGTAINPVVAGQQAYENDINSIKSGIRDPRSVDLGVKGPSFTLPRASGTAGNTPGLINNPIPEAPVFNVRTDLTKPGGIAINFGTNAGTAGAAGNAGGTAASQANVGGTANASKYSDDLTKKPEEEGVLSAGGGGGRSTAVDGRFRPPTKKAARAPKAAKGGKGQGSGNGVRFRIPGGKR